MIPATPVIWSSWDDSADRKHLTIEFEDIIIQIKVVVVSLSKCLQALDGHSRILLIESIDSDSFLYEFVVHWSQKGEIYNLKIECCDKNDN